MSLPWNRSSAEAADYEALLCERMALAGPAAQNFHLRRLAVRERSRAAAAQAKPSAGQPPHAQRAAGPRVQTPEQAAREQRKQAQLRAKHCVRRLQAAARVRRMLHEWHLRAFRRLVVRRSNGALTGDEMITLCSHTGIFADGRYVSFPPLPGHPDRLPAPICMQLYVWRRRTGTA